MVKKSSIWVVVLISIVALAFIATGCSKKQVVKQEAAAAPVMKEAPAPPPPAPVVEAPAPPPAPVVEAAPAPPPPPAKEEAAAKPDEKPAPLDLVTMKIWFAFDDYQLSTQSKENLEKIGGWMSKDIDVKIQIQGNTCDIGTAEYNLALGEQRATSAKKYLEGLGVSSPRLSTISYGKERPMLPNSNEANRSKNRRDEFVVAK
jgi:peptidoglycan-associated lipoprotein